MPVFWVERNSLPPEMRSRVNATASEIRNAEYRKRRIIARSRAPFPSNDSQASSSCCTSFFENGNVGSGVIFVGARQRLANGVAVRFLQDALFRRQLLGGVRHAGLDNFEDDTEPGALVFRVIVSNDGYGSQISDFKIVYPCRIVRANHKKVTTKPMTKT